MKGHNLVALLLDSLVVEAQILLHEPDQRIPTRSLRFLKKFKLNTPLGKYDGILMISRNLTVNGDGTEKIDINWRL